MDENQQHIQQFYTTDDVATMLQVDQQSVRRWVRLGKLKAMKLGKKYIRVSQKNLIHFIDSQTS